MIVQFGVLEIGFAMQLCRGFLVEILGSGYSAAKAANMVGGSG